MSRILVAEDDYISQKEVSIIIEKMDHIPFVSPNGKHAYEALTACNTFDLIITDFLMPELDGRELIHSIHNNASLNKIPIIVMSGVISINDITDLMNQGVSLFISKPIKAQLLSDYINKCLKK